MTHDFTVYQCWPPEEIERALGEFNAMMHDGAGVQELQAGLHGLDFLCRRSEIPPDLAGRVDGAITEANMRLELLLAQEAQERSTEENLERARKGIELLKRELDAMKKRIHRGNLGYAGDPDAIRAAIQERVRRRAEDRRS